MILLVGLGNYGLQYENTIHNAGFIFIDGILRKINSSTTWNEKYSGLYVAENFQGKKIIFIKPQTYMNNSGVCVAQFKNFYKIQNDGIFVFHDEIDLPMGKIKVKTGGGNAGHNGLKSLDAHIGNDYHRIRIGVGRPPNKEQEVGNFVLSKFSENDLEHIKDISNIFFLQNMIFLLEKQFSKLHFKK